MYWGQFGKVKVSGGGVRRHVARRATTTVLGAGRVQVDFWDPEAGYYLNGTYYGDKNLLAIGVAGQVQGERQDRLQRRFPPREEGRQRRRLLDREPSGRSTTSSAATTRSYGTDEGGYVLGELSLPEPRGHRASSRSSASSRQANFTRRPHAVDADYDQKTTRAQSQLRHQGVQRARDDLLQGHALRRRADQLQAVRRRPAAADVTGHDTCPRSFRFTEELNHETETRIARRGAAGGRRLAASTVAVRAGHHQGRRAAFAVRHDGHQRDDAEGHGPDADRRAEQERRAARQEARSGRRRSGVGLAALRREGARAAREGQGRGRLRLLDVGVQKVGAAGVREGQRPALLSRSSTRARSRRRTSSTPARRRTSRRFRRWTI